MTGRSGERFSQRQFAAPPVAARVPVEKSAHGDVRQDEFDWLRDPAFPEIRDPAILDFLRAENEYADAVLGAEPDLRQALYDEMKGRIVAEDKGVPYRHGGWFYWRETVEGGQYWKLWRKPAGGGDAQIVLDVDALATGHAFYLIAHLEPSPNHHLLAYAEDTDGSERWTIRLKDLTTGELKPDRIENASSDIAWSADGRHLFYVRLDENLRPKRVFRHRLGSDPSEDEQVYEEADPAFFTSVGNGRSGRFIFIQSRVKTQTEVRFIPADQPETAARLVVPRRPGHEYDVTDQGERFIIRTNDRRPEFRLVEAPVGDPGEANWRELLYPGDGVFVSDVQVFERWLVVEERSGGLPRLRVLGEASSEHFVEFPDAAFLVSLRDNPEYATDWLRLHYESPVTPPTTYDYDMASRRLEARKVLTPAGGFRREDYVLERRLAPARDGTMVPVTISRCRSTPLDGSAPLLLRGYGAYGHSLNPGFASAMLSLLNRGFIIATAHVRGGGELGRAWYEAGKLASKMNSFTDFIDVGEFLARESYTSRGWIAASGGSAGGLLVGTVINMSPDLFHAGVAQVPFVDALNTMLDPSLPLTALEYDEWGNPSESADAYALIKAYSPYDNVVEQAYPHMFVTAGISDPRVTYWEPAKWVARLRARKAGDNIILLRTEMTAGHGGKPGRFRHLEQVAEIYAFLLKAFGVT